MVQQVSLTRVQPRPIAVVREKVPPERLAHFVPAACGEVWAFLRAACVQNLGRNISLYLDDGTVESGVEVFSQFRADRRVVPSEIPGGLVATTTHFGPYHFLGNAHRAIREWCTSFGHQATGISWELYGHWMAEWDADPSKICTEVAVL